MIVADDTRVRLLDAAGQVFAEKGFEAATVRDICERAGANVSAVNYHFRGKEQLYRAALAHAFQCRLDQMPLPESPEGTPPVEKLRCLLRTMIAHMVDDRERPWQMQLLLRELSEPSEAGAALVRDLIRPLNEMVWNILREILPPGVPEEKLHLIGFSICGQVFYHRAARPVIALVVGEEEAHRYGGERLAEHVTAFTLAALGLAPPLTEQVKS
jgi:AcrR family transcriptional regulator